jgi:hypothetical protein
VQVLGVRASAKLLSGFLVALFSTSALAVRVLTYSPRS